MATEKQVKGTEKPVTSPKVGKSGREKMEITALMKSTVTECKKLIKGGATKAEAAREGFDLLPKYERRQVIHVFIEGCSLSKAGAGTYYQNCRNK
tara:strand:+ start:6086 stop:6370 length:285 start_codon:yes stop_codon:yes gene_type:complete